MMRYCSIILKCCIHISMMIHTMADWIQIPVLNPHQLVNTDYHFSHLGNSSYLNINIPLYTEESYRMDLKNSSISSSLSKNDHSKEPGKLSFITNNNTPSQNISFPPEQKEHATNKSNQIDTNLLMSIMNNSQKVDKTGHEHISSGQKTIFGNILNKVHRKLQEIPSSINGKMKFLQNLKLILYSYIKPHIRRLWGAENRQARTDKGMGFPSMDGALMTICFLLFAVYLIKLVQQLIQQLQDKANAQAIMMTAAVTPAPAAGGRRKRAIMLDTDAAAYILHLIESFNPDM